MLIGCILALLCLGPSQSTLTFQRVGWLDKMVAHHKKLFFKDVERMPPEPIRATIEAAPPGYVDSPSWNFDSVMRLIALVQASESAAPVRRAIRRALQPTRRLFVDKGHNTFKLFPSLTKHNTDNFYYEIDSLEYYEESVLPGKTNISDDSIIIVSNPVEARLPSAQISVRLLREIMEARSMAAREMPTTTKSTFSWVNFTKKNTSSPGASDVSTDTTAGNATATDAGATTGAASVSADGETTVAGGDTTIASDQPAEETTRAAAEVTHRLRRSRDLLLI